MKHSTSMLLAFLAATTLALAGCSGGGGGGGGGGETNPDFTTTSLTKANNASTFSAGVAINDGNEVVGLSDDGLTTVKAVAWTVTTSGATTTSVPTVLTLPGGAGAYSAAYGISDSGAIVGEMEAAPAGPVVAAFWSSRTATAQALQLLAPATESAAYGINSAGRIVGELLADNSAAAAIWMSSAAVPVLLPVPVGATASSAYSINDNGEIVGELSDAFGTRAVLWKPNATGAYAGSPTLLPSVDGDSLALTINTAGHIAGEAAAADGKMHAVRWMRDAAGNYAMTDLGPANVASSAAGINDAGSVVGHVRDAADAVSTASAWRATPPVAPFTIDTALTFSQAYAINNLGHAVGYADGQAFVAVPK